MEFQQVVDRRRMVRNYSDEPVDPQVVERILRNALHAPSAGFSQGWAFLLLDTPADIDRFWEHSMPTEPGTASSSPTWLEDMRRAPVIVVPLSHKRGYLERYAEPDKGWTDLDEGRWPVPYWDIDTGMAALLMLLTITDEGLGSCFFGIPPESMGGFREAFNVPADYTPIGALTIGHRVTDERSTSLKRGRKQTSEVVHHSRW
jgi:nitroreductase